MESDHTHDLIDRWDRQQAAYIADREGRFTAMLDVLAAHSDDQPAVVIDLACGPGSLSFRVLKRFPRAHVVGIDLNPALLALARAAAACYGDRVHFLDADLTSAEWTAAVRDVTADAPITGVLSTTALHWLSPAQLLEAYGQVRSLLPDGGMFLDGDHLRFDDRQPQLRAWAARHETRIRDAALASGAESWEDWWTAMDSLPEFQPLLAEGRRRSQAREASESTTVGFRVAALAQAGFVEYGTVWQLMDDFVVYGVA